MRARKKEDATCAIQHRYEIHFHIDEFMHTAFKSAILNLQQTLSIYDAIHAN